MLRADLYTGDPTKLSVVGYALGTMQFLKENWVWILAPIVLFAAVAAFLFLSGDGSAVSDGTYTTH